MKRWDLPGDLNMDEAEECSLSVNAYLDDIFWSTEHVTKLSMVMQHHESAWMFFKKKFDYCIQG